MDAAYGQVSLWRCSACGGDWLHYHYEMEGFSGSGRWYLGPIPDRTAITVDAGRARETLERLDWYFYGGATSTGAAARRLDRWPDALGRRARHISTRTFILPG